MESFKKHFENYRLMRESVDYKLPKDPGILMSDFYMLNYMRTTDINLLSQHKTAGALRAENQLDDIQYAENIIIPSLKKQMLNDVFFALCAEIRHVFSNRNPIKDDPFFLKFFRAYNNFTSDIIDDPRKPEDRGKFKDNNRGYQDSYAAVKYVKEKMDLTFSEVVRKMEMAFSEWTWSPNFGGEAWANIAKGWLRLNNAKTKDETYVAIDHVYDLQHNTDTVFNKLKKYYKFGGYSWIRSALDFKANIKSMQELVPETSARMKQIARPFLQATGDGPKETKVQEKPNPSLKYELMEHSKINLNGKTLYRIRALRDFGFVKTNEIGGYIEKESNLSHDGNCWVYDNSKVYDNAKVFGDVRLYINTKVYGDAEVYDKALLYGGVIVNDKAKVFNNAKLYDNTSVSGFSKIYGNVQIYGDSIIFGNAEISGNKKMHDVEFSEGKHE